MSNNKLVRLSHRSESMLSLILNNLVDKNQTRWIKWVDGNPWTRIPVESFMNILKCSNPCVFAHIAKLEEFGIISRKQLGVGRDCANYYSINAEVVQNKSKELAEVFSKSIIKRLREFYDNVVKKVNDNAVKKVDALYNNNINHINHTSRKSLDVSESCQANQIKVCQAKQAEVVVEGVDISPLPTASKSPIPPKTTTVQDMHQIWNEVMQRDDKLNKKTARYLVACFQRKFESSLDRWREYVVALKRSTFIQKLGEKMKYLLSWALSFKVINRIFDGGFGVKLDPSEESEKKAAFLAGSKAINHIESLSEPAECIEVRIRVLEKFGANTYNNWFDATKIKLETSKDGRILITGRSFIVDYIKQNFLNDSRFLENPESEVREVEHDYFGLKLTTRVRS